MSDGIEKGYKWWIRYVIVPLIGSGGMVAIIVALLTRTPPTSTPSLTPPTPTEVRVTMTAELTSTPTMPSEEATEAGITYGFEDGTPQGWRAWEREVGLTIQALTVTEFTSSSGQRALQVDVKGLSGSEGATIYFEKATPTRIFSVKARLPSNAASDVDVWVQLAAASVIGSFQESKIVYLGRNKWCTIEWDTSSYGWEDGSVRAIYIQLGAGNVKYNGPIYIDEIYVR